MKYKSILSLFILLFIKVNLFAQDSKHLICFDFDSDKVSPTFDDEMNQIVAILKTNNYSFIRIFGYATKMGDSTYNMDLSKRRAYSVYNFINKSVLIDSGRFYMTWIGESLDDYDLHYENSHPQSRCVDVWIQRKMSK